MPRHSDITVAGAGIVGASTALALQRCGHRVTLIDKWGAGNSRASSTDYNRVIRAIYGRDVFYTRLAREARELWLELQTETGQQLYYECGALVLATAGQCQWEGNTCETFKQLGVPHHRFSKEEVAMRFPQFKVDDIAYGIYEPEAGMLMAHRAVITTVNLFKRLGGLVKTGEVTTDGAERPLLDGRPIQSDVTVIATGPWMADLFPRTVKPIGRIVGINVLYTSTPAGLDRFDHENMPCWIDRGQGSFGMPSVEGHGVKAAVVIPEKIDIDNDERLIRRASLTRTRDYIRKRLPDLIGQRIVDSKFNQIILTPDTHFIADWHPEHRNLLLVGGCSGHLFKHGPVMGKFAAGLALGEYNTAPRFKLEPRQKLSPAESPSGR